MTIRGELIIWEEGGGYSTPSVRVKTANEEISIAELIERVIPGCPMKGGNTGYVVDLSLSVLAVKRCQCACGSECPLGKSASEPRCTEQELDRALRKIAGKYGRICEALEQVR